MSLFIIRHAHAVDVEEEPTRPLSKRGRKQVRQMAAFLKKTDALRVDEIWHSPLARSVETAKLLAKRLGLRAKLVEVDGLKGEDDPSVVAGRLKSCRLPLAIVGHEPHLSAFLSLLVAGAPEPRKFLLKKCAVVALEYDDGQWAVRWQIAPELLPDSDK